MESKRSFDEASLEQTRDGVTALPRESRVDRRRFVQGATAIAVGSVLLRGQSALADAAEVHAGPNLAAVPPSGFVPFTAPGRIVKVTKSDSLMPNKLYPKADDARQMLERAMIELTGKPDLVQAVGRFVHKDDKVCVKVNGIAQQNMTTNKELVLPFIDAMIAAGVPPENITVLEQWYGYFTATRISEKNVPAGVKISIHNNTDAKMAERLIPGTGISTRFCTALTESTAVINFGLIKDHSICGYTGALKNMAQGCQLKPALFHGHHASPQIAMLYAQDIVKTRVRLNVVDGFKIMADGGPLWRQPQYVFPHEAVYVSTDPVAIDALGMDLVDKARVEHHLPTVAAVGRPAAYIQTAADLGLGICDLNQIELKSFAI
jgi:uncharacterized protein (DUF362 family)